MSEYSKDRLMDHKYDGIQEYDNPIPMWLNLILIGSVVFSFFYFIFFQIGPLMGTNGWTRAEAYDAAVADNLKLRFAEIGELQPDEATLVKYTKKENEAWLAVGLTVYKTHCQSCHAENGRGQVGPNLTDDYYKQIKTLTDIATVIENGAANGSMPAWRNRLHPNEIVLVSAYVASLRGKNLSGPRGQEGQLIDPWPTDSSEKTSTEYASEPAENKDAAAGQGEDLIEEKPAESPGDVTVE